MLNDVLLIKSSMGKNMVEYRIVKYCKLCKCRFVVEKKDARQFYCDKCEEKLDKEKADKEKAENEKK